MLLYGTASPWLETREKTWQEDAYLRSVDRSFKFFHGNQSTGKVDNRKPEDQLRFALGYSTRPV